MKAKIENGTLHLLAENHEDADKIYKWFVEYRHGKGTAQITIPEEMITAKMAGATTQ